MTRARGYRRRMAAAGAGLLALASTPALAQDAGGELMRARLSVVAAAAAVRPSQPHSLIFLFPTTNQKTAPQTPLPDGSGPLYTSADAVLASLSSWATSNPRLFSLHNDQATDPETQNSLAVAVFTAADDQEQGTDPSNTTTVLPKDQRARVFITCGIHARELITVDTCFALLRLLASPLDADALALLNWPEMRSALSKAGIISESAAVSATRALPAVRAAARRLAATTELTVMPLLNPTSRRTIETKGQFKLRVNGRGVDLNRNMKSNWKPPAPGQRPGSDTYPGPSAASEWETRAVNAATSARGVDSYMDLHSGFVSLMGPSAASPCGLKETMTRDSAKAHQRAMQAMQKVMPSPTVAGPTARVLYPAAGTTLDDAFNLRGARVSLAVEVYDDQFASRAGYSCPSYEAFWNAPCDSGEGGNGSVKCRELGVLAAGAREEGQKVVPRVPDGELMWDEIQDEAKLRELRELHGVSHDEVAKVSVGARMRAAAKAVGGDRADSDSSLPERTVSAEPWWRDDPVMKHATGDWGDEGWNYLTTFNPTTPAMFRDTVARWVAALWAFALDAERQQK